MVLGEASFRRSFAVALRRLLAVLLGALLTTLLPGLLILLCAPPATRLLVTICPSRPFRLSSLTVSLVPSTGTSPAALEARLLVAPCLPVSLLALLSAALLAPVLLSAPLLSAVLLVPAFGAAASLASPLALRVLSLVSVPVLVSLLRPSLLISLLSASSLTALSVLADTFGPFVLMMRHGRKTLLPDSD
ncbi:hypothetical protein [Halostella pelagica]|uniref:hypothetical protein n=1 Tax=Halostella pelagica TaxID=2583824 RepID=UPI0010806AFA|nr:hypothetical protein [Halostella pelagica]